MGYGWIKRDTKSLLRPSPGRQHGGFAPVRGKAAGLARSYSYQHEYKCSHFKDEEVWCCRKYTVRALRRTMGYKGRVLSMRGEG